MPISPVVGKDFKTANGLKASIIQFGPADALNRRYFGLVRTNGDFTYTLWRANGVNPSDANWNIESEWPTNSPVRYQPIMATQDGTWKVMAAFYSQVSELSADWKPKGCKWYATVDRDVSSNPTLAVSSLP